MTLIKKKDKTNLLQKGKKKKFKIQKIKLNSVSNYIRTT